ncbi:MAG: hypothetical protein ACOCVM_02180 [Desulfovibrionaceae bacterium]
MLHIEQAARPDEPIQAKTIAELKQFLDSVHIRTCLVEPYKNTKNYPLVEARELLPSFEPNLIEYKNLPGFSLVALERPIDYFREVFQFDILHSPHNSEEEGFSASCPLERSIQNANLETLRRRLPKKLGDQLEIEFCDRDVCDLDHYQRLTPFLLAMDRAQVLSTDRYGQFYLSGAYASLPSDLDAELKRFGMRIGKFKPGDNLRYERNRPFVYQYLMELYGFPIASERRTSAALFARRLFRVGETFLIRVMGQSDRTITTLYSHPKEKFFPRLEKLALFKVSRNQKDTIAMLREEGYFVDEKRRVVIVRVTYKQHTFNPNNVQEWRALSISGQEVVHPETGQVLQGLNLIGNPTNLILRLNDIVRGEYAGLTTYKGMELVQDTDTHEKRLKFLHTWLTKHQSRVIGQSPEFFADMCKVLDSYLLAPEKYEIFKETGGLFQEVWTLYSYTQQARKVLALEQLQLRRRDGKRIPYLEMLKTMSELLSELKFEVSFYFEGLMRTVLHIGGKVANDKYLLNNYVNLKDENLSDYGRDIKKYYGRIVNLLDDLRAIGKSRSSA